MTELVYLQYMTMQVLRCITGLSLISCAVPQISNASPTQNAPLETIFVRYIGTSSSGYVFDVAFQKGHTLNNAKQRLVSKSCNKLPLGEEFEASVSSDKHSFSVGADILCYGKTSSVEPLHTFQGFEIFTSNEQADGSSRQNNLKDIVRTIGPPVREENFGQYQVLQWCKTWDDDEFGVGMFENGNLKSWDTYRVTAHEALRILGLSKLPAQGVDCARTAQSRLVFASRVAQTIQENTDRKVRNSNAAIEREASDARAAKFEADRLKSLQDKVTAIDLRFKTEKSYKVKARLVAGQHFAGSNWFEISGDKSIPPFFISETCAHEKTTPGSWFDAQVTTTLLLVSRESGISCDGKFANTISGRALTLFLLYFPDSAAKYESFVESLAPREFGVKDCWI